MSLRIQNTLVSLSHGIPASLAGRAASLSRLWWDSSLPAGRRARNDIKRGMASLKGFLGDLNTLKVRSENTFKVFHVEDVKGFFFAGMAMVGENAREIANHTVMTFKVASSNFMAIITHAEPTKIDKLRAENITPTSAVIQWETNHYATSKVNYGFSTSYSWSVADDERVKQHVILLNNLQPGKKYYYEVMSQNKTYVYDAYYTFETPEDGATSF